MKNKPIELIVALSDIHAGSTKAILPPDFSTLEGNEINLNSIQEWIWECWVRAHEFTLDIVGDDPFALVINGDLLEGNHHGTKEIWSPEVGDHAICAKALLEPLAGLAEKTFVVRGTECHTQNHEQSVAMGLGAELNEESGIHSFDRLTLEIKGVVCVFRHHIGSSIRRSLRATQLSVTLAEEQLEAANNGEVIPRVIVCSHRHTAGIYRDDNGMIVVTPAWQAQTRFVHKIASAARCKPGIQILDFRNTHENSLPQVHEKYFQAPSANVIKL